MPKEPDSVRTNWRQLYLRDLTQAERKLAQEARDKIMHELRMRSPKAVARMAERWISDIGSELGVPPAKEIAS